MLRVRRLAMGLLGLGVAAGLVGAAVSVANHLHMEGGTFASEAEELVARSEEVRERAGPDYQERVLDALPPNPLTGEVLRLDERLPEATVVREEVPSPEDAPFLRSYEFEGPGRAGLESPGGRLGTELREGVLTLRHAAEGYLTNGEPLDVPMDAVGEIVLRARVERGNYMRLSWSTEAELDPQWEGPGKPKIDLPVVADDRFRTYVVDAKSSFKASAAAGRRLRRLYLKPSDLAGDRVEIEFVRIVSKHRRYRAAPRGLSYEKIGQETRRVLYTVPQQALRYELRVPAEDPLLELGTGLLSDEAAVTFRVELAHEGAREVLHEATLRDASRWRDARIDLAPWAGRRVALTLSAEGSSENVAFWSSPRISSRPERPFNVVIILEDTLRADHLSAYGYGRRTSPMKERLAAEEGVLFENAVSQATMTRPSVASMMTSLYPTATGVWKFTDMLGDSYLTLAEILRHQGFVTGSFIQNPQAGPAAGLHQGFDVLFDRDATSAEGSTSPRPEELFDEELLRWIDRNDHRNFFLYLHATDPHGPYEPSEERRHWYRAVERETPVERDEVIDPPWVDTPTVEGRKALYDGEIRHNDEVIERFLTSLRRRGLDERTLLILLSDHGEHLGEHGGLWEHHPPGFRQVTHVPLLVAHPERFEGGRRVSPTVQLLDVMPTVLELAGVDTDPLLAQGDSLVPLLRGGEAEGWRDRVVLSEESMSMDKSRPERNRGLRAIGSVYYRDWHFIASRWLWPGRYVPESLRLQAFSMEGDPDEDDPLWRFAPDLWMRLRFSALLNDVQTNNAAAHERWTTEEHDETHHMDPEALERLRALGYVE